MMNLMRSTDQEKNVVRVVFYTVGIWPILILTFKVDLATHGLRKVDDIICRSTGMNRRMIGCIF